MRESTTPKSPPQSGSPSSIEFGRIDPVIFDAVEYLRPEDLRILPGNPRKHDEGNIESIARALAVRRWEEFTGRDAVLEATDEIFAATAAGRADAGPTVVSPRARKWVLPAS